MLVLKPAWGGLVRLGLVLATGSSLAFALGLLYPVQRELDLARYEHASYTYEVEGVFPQSVSSAVSVAIGPDTCLVSVWLTMLRSEVAEVGPTELDGVSPSCPAGQSRFPAATMVAEGSDTSPDWIDLAADAARTLQVGPGGTVEVMVAPTLPPVKLRVRKVFALRAAGAAAAAMAPADVLFAHLPEGEQGGYGLALTRTPPPAFLQRLATDPLKSELEAAKGYPPVITTVATRLDGAAQSSSNSLGLVRTIGALAVLGVVALTLRELDVFRRRCVPVVQLVHKLGGSGSRLLAGYFGLAAVVGVTALSLGLLVARAGYTFGIVSSTMPPTLAPVLVVVWAGAIAVLIAFFAVMGPWTRKRIGM